jgi:hypothetical protein
MTDLLISKAEQHDYRRLFLHDLHWSAPDHTPIDYTSDGQTLTATNISSYKGLRVWVCDEKPGSQLEAQLDREIAKTSTDRLVIYHDEVDQVWRWPVRRIKGAATITRLTSHRHHTGAPNPKFEARLEAIRLPLDRALDPNAVLAKVRAAFDVETQNETKQASKLMARMYAAMEKAYPSDHDRSAHDHQISVTLARILFLIFGDDTDMWNADLFRDFIHNHTEANGSDIGSQLNHLFVHLDTPPAQRHDAAAQLKDFPYINGGIFRERVTLPEVNAEFRVAILDACAVDWATISPAIFGSMFQSVRDAQTRRELGEHYTSEENILKTLNPLFLDDLRADFEHARTMKNEALALRRLRDRLGEIRYMDPACGCGNFIIVAYRELRDLELAIMERLQEITGDDEMLLANVGLKVTLDHFYGIEIDEWPAKIAETAMFLIDRQCDLKLTERLGWAPDRLPIQSQAMIVVGNALTTNWDEVCPPNNHVVIAGNPPFLGKKQRTSEQTAVMQAVWGSAYSGEADFVTTWFAKAAQYFENAPGEWAFVATNSVVQGVTVAPVFAYLFDKGWSIKFAHRTFAWTSEAAGKAIVHCAIVGFTKDPSAKLRLFDYDTSKSEPNEIPVSSINAYLVDGPNLLVHDSRKALSPQLRSDIRFGSMAADGGGLLVSPSEYDDLVLKDPVAIKHLRRFVGARELLHSLDRWCIWMPEPAMTDIAASPFLRHRVEHVRQFRAEEAKDAGVRAAAATPYRFNRIQQPRAAYLCIPRHVSETRPFFPAARFDAAVIAGDANFVVDDPDGFFFAVISSSMFITWQRTVGGRLKSDLRFASTFTWNTLPLPYLDAAVRSRIIEAGEGVLVARRLHPSKSLAQHYTPDAMDPELVVAHERLDTLVDRAFGGKARCDTERERQQLLFSRYEELTAPLLVAASKGRAHG